MAEIKMTSKFWQLCKEIGIFMYVLLMQNDAGALKKFGSFEKVEQCSISTYIPKRNETSLYQNL
jgi:hypothetical protein